jgi:hypothetical protein
MVLDVCGSGGPSSMRNCNFVRTKKKGVRLTLPASPQPRMQSDSSDEDPLYGRRVTDDENEDGVIHYDREEANGSAVQTKKGMRRINFLFLSALCLDFKVMTPWSSANL